jgi:hypothetical protein
LPQSFRSLLQFELTEILLHDVGHGHAQRGGKIALRHCLLFFGILQKPDQAAGQICRISRLIELNRQFFSIAHLAEIRQIGADDRHSEGAGKVCHSTAAGRRGIRHYGHG